MSGQRARRPRRVFFGMLAVGTCAVMLSGCSSGDKGTSSIVKEGGAPEAAAHASGGSGGTRAEAAAGGQAGETDSGPHIGTGGAGGAVDARAPDADAGPTRVKAVAVDTYVTESKKILQPVDLSTYDVAAFVPDAVSAGAFKQYLPVVTGPGAFDIDVPDGIYYLKYNRIGGTPLYIVTRSRSLDLGATRAGRPDVERASSGTTLVVNADGLNPWQDGDDISFYAANAGSTLYTLNDQATSGAPAVGATTLSALTVDYANLARLPNLLDGSKGDRGSIVQLVTRPLAVAGSYTAAGKIFNLPSFSMADGQTTTVNGSFTDVPQSSSISVDWKLSEFLSLGAANPSATPNLSLFTLLAQLAPEEGSFSDYVSLIEYQTTGTTDIVASLDYGNPFPAAYGRLVGIRQGFRRQYSLPGGSPVSLAGEANAVALATSAVTMRPIVGPVTNLRVNASDALGDVSGVGRNPTISWNLPTLGSPTSYSVLVWRLSVNAGATARALAGAVFTTSTTLIVPPGLLLSGEKYVMEVFARSESGLDKDLTPLKAAYPSGQAPVLSGIIAP